MLGGCAHIPFPKHMIAVVYVLDNFCSSRTQFFLVPAPTPSQTNIIF